MFSMFYCEYNMSLGGFYKAFNLFWNCCCNPSEERHMRSENLPKICPSCLMILLSLTVKYLYINTVNMISASSVDACKAGSAVDAELASAIMARQFHPPVTGPEVWEGYVFSGLEILIKESTDLYGAVLWPSVSPKIVLEFRCDVCS